MTTRKIATIDEFMDVILKDLAAITKASSTKATEVQTKSKRKKVWTPKNEELRALWNSTANKVMATAPKDISTKDLVNKINAAAWRATFFALLADYAENGSRYPLEEAWYAADQKNSAAGFLREVLIRISKIESK